MTERVRVEVRNQQSGLIVGFIYYDLGSWLCEEFIITAVDDGKKLITGLDIPQVITTPSQLQTWFGCKYPKINSNSARLRDF